ncbi:hypothetical protein [Nostoc sp. FACHB-280]|uniref:hypothetical protein n=1 Tax=Nostoc sp. FACHB-280 TaxID=2692839 RepID=UPI00168B3FAB|nr:hypothetical protein [Nostoc sp. FACHB-280]MBD2496183.1 hypothetical protein [Nostoc sp. FACHB-280]
MKVKTVYASMAIATLIATGVILVAPNNVLAQESINQTEHNGLRDSKSMEIQWLLGFIPWPTWNKNSNSPKSKNLVDGATYANNPNNPIQVNIGGSKKDTPNGKKHPSNYKEVPVPLLIPGLTAFGLGLIRKHRQEQKQINM